MVLEIRIFNEFHSDQGGGENHFFFPSAHKNLLDIDLIPDKLTFT
jgi:hypothetical protein